MIFTPFSHDGENVIRLNAAAWQKTPLFKPFAGLESIHFHDREIAGLCKRTVKTTCHWPECRPKTSRDETARRKIFIFRDFPLDKHGSDAYTEPINPPAMTRRANAHSRPRNKTAQATMLLKRPHGPWEVFCYKVSDGFPARRQK